MTLERGLVQLADVKVQWLAFVNTIMNLRVPIKGWELVDNTNSYQFLKKEPALCT